MPRRTIVDPHCESLSCVVKVRFTATQLHTLDQLVSELRVSRAWLLRMAVIAGCRRWSTMCGGGASDFGRRHRIRAVRRRVRRAGRAADPRWRARGRRTATCRSRSRDSTTPSRRADDSVRLESRVALRVDLSLSGDREQRVAGLFDDGLDTCASRVASFSRSKACGCVPTWPASGSARRRVRACSPKRLCHAAETGPQREIGPRAENALRPCFTRRKGRFLFPFSPAVRVDVTRRRKALVRGSQVSGRTCCRGPVSPVGPRAGRGSTALAGVGEVGQLVEDRDGAGGVVERAARDRCSGVILTRGFCSRPLADARFRVRARHRPRSPASRRDRHPGPGHGRENRPPGRSCTDGSAGPWRGAWLASTWSLTRARSHDRNPVDRTLRTRPTQRRGCPRPLGSRARTRDDGRTTRSTRFTDGQ